MAFGDFINSWTAVSTTDPSVTISSPTENNLLIAYFVSDAVSADIDSNPAGWSLVRERGTSATTNKSAFYYKVSAGDETACACGFTGTGYRRGLVAEYAWDGSTPDWYSSIDGNETPGTIVPTGLNNIVLAGANETDGSGWATSITINDGFTKDVVEDTADSTYPALALARNVNYLTSTSTLAWAPTPGDVVWSWVCEFKGNAPTVVPVFMNNYSAMRN